MNETNVMVILRMDDTTHKPVVMGVFTDAGAMEESLGEYLADYYNERFGEDDEYAPVDVDEYVENITTNLRKHGRVYDDLFGQTFYKQTTPFGVIS